VVGCKYHPEQPRHRHLHVPRPSVACCTRIDGINHCHACLEKVARRAERAETPVILGRIAAVLVLGVTWLLFVGLLWLGEGWLAP
jgi:hypothetical protein